MKIKNLLSLSLTLVLLAIAPVIQSQTLEDVASKYNAAAELVNTDPAKAATLLEEAIALAKKTGAEADEIRIMAESQLPAVFFRVAGEQQKAGNTDEAIATFRKSFDLGLEYNDPNTVSRAQNILGRLYLSQGNNAYRAGENEKAVALLNSSLEYDTENARTWLLLGLTYRKLENAEEMKTAMDQAIAKAQKAIDEQTKASAEKSMRDFLAVRANRSIQANKGAEAIEMMNLAINYGEEAQTYFLLTMAHNNLKQWDNAITAAQKALELEDGDAVEKAKIYFEIGNALREKGDTAGACEAFKNAAYGNYKESANYQIQQVLKCN